jgi:hypothetical protein
VQLNREREAACSLQRPAQSERVADFAAFEKHLNGPVFQGWLKKYISLFLTNSGNLFVVSEWLERQYGYIRPQMVTPP